MWQVGRANEQSIYSWLYVYQLNVLVLSNGLKYLGK